MARAKCLLPLAAALLLCSIAATEAMPDGWNTIFHQVAIRVRQPVLDKIEDFHLCNGLILDTFYVVTTARCLFMRPDTNDSLVYVAAGHLANDDITNQLNFTIENVIFHPDFLQKQQHDIALIKVAERLPASGIVAIPGVQDSVLNCSVIVRDQEPSGYFKIVTDIKVAPDRYCTSALPGASDVGDDDFYCAQYQMDHTWCSATEEQVRNSGDLGSALICNSVFLGVMSEIQFPTDQFNFPCNMPRRTFATYTSLDEHSNWLYQIMGRLPNVPTDPDIIDPDHDAAVTIRQTAGVLMITAALYIFFYM